MTARKRTVLLTSDEAMGQIVEALDAASSAARCSCRANTTSWKPSSSPTPRPKQSCRHGCAPAGPSAERRIGTAMPTSPMPSMPSCSLVSNLTGTHRTTTAAGGDYDVIIDAGNSTVLDTHVEGGYGGGHNGGADAAPSYTSSVTIPVAADGTKPTDAELQAVATVTSDQAIAAALANTPGTAGTAELKSVAGNVVWDVDVTATAGGDYDVIIDAGNSTVLDTHVEGGHGGGHHGNHADDTTDAAATATTTG